MESIIVITNESNKKNILRELSKNKLLYNIKFFSFLELKKKIYFDYDNNTISYIMEKFNVPFGIAKTYLDNMYFLENIADEKVSFLRNLKSELEDNKLLIKSDSFKKYIRDKKVIVYGFSNLTKEQKLILEHLDCNYTIKSKDEKGYRPQVYEAKTKDEEIEFVLDKISDLIYQGKNINDIKIIINDDYEKDIKRYFNLYEIPLNMNSKSSYYSTSIAQEFLRNYDTKEIEDNISDLSLKYKNVDDLITIINKSVLVENKALRKEFITNDLKNLRVKQNVYDNAVSVGSILDTFKDSDYVFLLGFNLNFYPRVVRDEDFLSDEVKDKLGLDTSTDINYNKKEEIKNKIREIKNLTITYRLRDGNQVYYPSLLIMEMGLEVKKVKITNKISYSKVNSSIKYASFLDLLYKYNTISDDLGLFRNNLNIKYREYNNEFKGINHDLFKEFLGQELVLAYTNMEMYNECAFRYYLSKIIKIDIYEENFKTIIGTVVHHILELSLKREINIPVEIMSFIKDKGYSLGAREYFYLDKLSKELEEVVLVIKNQARHSKLDKYLFEEELYVYLDREDFKITFKGLIDKVAYQEKDGKEILAVVDYKTGVKSVSLDNLKYGLNMQLPIYLYLLKKSERFKDALIGGFYIQKVLNNIPNISDKSLEQVRKDSMKLQGYSNSSEAILELIDDEYQEGKIIKDLKYKKDGTITKKAKVLSNKEMDQLTEVVEEKIKECIDNILEGNFKINPKVIGGINNSCLYCKFKDICFKEKKDEVILGGDDDESDQRAAACNS